MGVIRSTMMTARTVLRCPYLCGGEPTNARLLVVRYSIVPTDRGGDPDCAGVWNVVPAFAGVSPTNTAFS